MSGLSALRRARHRDLEGLVVLWGELIRYHVPLDPHYRLGPDADATWREYIGGLIGSPTAAVFVSGEEGAPDAFCCVELRAPSRMLAESGRAEITDLFVSPELRRCGRGRALVEAALAWIGERGIVRVEVRVVHANRDGQAFWRALGWTDFVDVLQRRL
jgi:GNAT superfamily N-acetyltransferase